MGNKVSISNKDNLHNNLIIPITLLNTLIIPKNYIYNMTFDDLVKLDKPEYCEKIAILTEKQIKNNLKDLEISYLVQNKKWKTNISCSKSNRCSSSKRKINDLDISNKFLKTQACKGIGKYYVKLAHVFATIVKAVNPLYMYKDINGIQQVESLINKNKISDVYKPTLKTDYLIFVQEEFKN